MSDKKEFVSELLRVVRFLLRPRPTEIGASLLFAVGLQAVYGDDFVLGTLSLSLSAVWGIAAWWLSDELQRRRPQPPRKQKYAQIEKYKHSRHRYLLWKFSIPVFIMAVLILSAFFVSYKREQNILKEYEGFLLPANDPDPPNSCNFEIGGHKMMSDSALKVFLGKIMVSYSMFPHRIFTVNGKNPLVLNRDEAGRIALTMDIFDKDEKIVVEFREGHFRVNPNTQFDMKRPDRSTLIVRDNYKNEVLNIRYVNRHAVRVAALLQYSQAKPVQIRGTQFADVCLGDVGSVGVNFDSPK